MKVGDKVRIKTTETAYNFAPNHGAEGVIASIDCESIYVYTVKFSVGSTLMPENYTGDELELIEASVQPVNAEKRIEMLESALDRLLLAFNKSLAGKPIRDADEVIEEAETALNRVRPLKA